MTRHTTWTVTAALLCGLAGGALADGSTDALLRAELEIMGATGAAPRSADPAPRAFDQIGGEGLDDPPDEIGGSGGDAPEQRPDGGPSNLGTKVKAGTLSALLPGAGQYYNDQRTKAYVMAGVEVGIWTAFFVFDTQGDNRMESSREWAAIYAGTRGEHDDRWWQAVGKYMDSDAYSIDQAREARALGESLPPPLTGSDTWQWVNEDRRTSYQKLRADGNSAYDRRDFMILFAVINRAISVVDAVIGAGGEPGKLETEVLGMGVELRMQPSWRDPGARCALTRTF